MFTINLINTYLVYHFCILCINVVLIHINPVIILPQKNTMSGITGILIWKTICKCELMGLGWIEFTYSIFHHYGPYMRADWQIIR